MLKFVAAIFVVGALSGCAVTDQFNGRVARFDVEVTQSRDAMILANIVRASKSEPLSFVQVGKVSGTTTAAATAGLPALIFGPHVTAAVNASAHVAQSETVFGGSALSGQGFVGNSAQMSGSTNFEVTPSETKEFYRALLNEVDPRTLEFFVEQGISRELLFYLFTDRIIEERGGKISEFRNDPLEENYPRFKAYVNAAMSYGLSSEQLTVAKPRPDRSDKKTNGAPSTADPASKEKWHLCFDRRYAKVDLVKNGNSPICGENRSIGDDRTVKFRGRDGQMVTLKVAPRSVFAIFQFLGRIVAAGDRGQIKLESPEAIDVPPFADDTLFRVDRNSTENCFVSVEHEGDLYCIPREGSANTKRILGLVTQLIALSTTISDIPVTPTVRLLQ